MKAVIYTGGRQSWAKALGNRPWALLPVGSRPLLSYWLELCVDLGIEDVQIILEQDAEHIERFCGNGETWGLNIDYSFTLPGDCPQEYLTRDPLRWNEGLLFVADALFPRRMECFTPDRLFELRSGCCVTSDSSPVFFLSENQADIDAFIHNRACGLINTETLQEAGLEIITIADVSQYYDLNMIIVKGEMDRYLSSGYASSDGASIGFNVITPPSVMFTPPLAIGNDCRLGALCSIGAGTVISDHVMIDRQSELSECIILSDTYIGRNLEIKGKIVSGNRIIDPEDGSWIDITDSWLVAPTRSRMSLQDLPRAILGWGLALGLVLVQLIPFLILYGLIRAFRLGTFKKQEIQGMDGRPTTTACFLPKPSTRNLLVMMLYGASLDRFPQLLDVLSGKLWLCGQVPRTSDDGDYSQSRKYFPAVFRNTDAFADIDQQMDALYYAHTRSIVSDLKILHHALFCRLIEPEIVSADTVNPA